MIGNPVEVPAPGGTSDSILFAQAGGDPRPAVIDLTDIGGIRPATREMAQRLASGGYTVLLPNAFYRTTHAPFELRFKPGDEASMRRFKELTEPLTPEAMEHDASAYIDFLATRAEVSQGPMAVVGHCFTGAMALRAAAARPDRIALAVSFHGGGLYTTAPTSPHLVLSRVKARLYFGHATQDRSMPKEAIESLDQALQSWGGRFESEVFDGAYHSWTAKDSPVFNPEQAERAFQKLVTLLKETLPARV